MLLLQPARPDIIPNAIASAATATIHRRVVICGSRMARVLDELDSQNRASFTALKCNRFRLVLKQA